MTQWRLASMVAGPLMPGWMINIALIVHSDEALLALIADEFAVIVMDVRMPDVSGYELAQLIKQRLSRRRAHHVPAENRPRPRDARGLPTRELPVRSLEGHAEPFEGTRLRADAGNNGGQ